MTFCYNETFDIPLSVSINITVKDNKNDKFAISRLLKDAFNFDFTHTTDAFRFCLSVLLEQDTYSEEEIETATKVLSYLTNHDDGFNITSEVVEDLHNAEHEGY
tara:strand:- start:390 stop:701 length:312 start_codon:yes stop_codon:yes gene_type:complete